MKKYTDAKRLKAKLDEHYIKYESKYMETRTPYTQGLIDALDLAEQVIDSLQQEQPEVDLEKTAMHVYESWMGGTMDDVRRDMVELGRVLNARKKDYYESTR